MPANNHIELVEKAMRILEVLADVEDPLDLKDLTARVGMVKSSVYRILYTLRELGYVEQHGRGSYRLTGRVSSLARRASAQPGLIEVARPYLTAARDALNEAAWLAQWRGGRVVLVDVVEAPHKLRLSLGIGDSCPLHASSLGKAVAAFLRPETLAVALGTDPLPRFTERTITERAQLLRELARVRAGGFAINEEETIDGAVLVGAPVLDSTGEVTAAVSLGSPMARCTTPKREEMIELVRHTGGAISQRLAELGYRRG
ncbi:MAG TPA: IclR family transcriptional regulator [Bryobacteraceae bacterium]|nr:IclR family transcriptional regulator [Bryobacteraceae bacterium]